MLIIMKFLICTVLFGGLLYNTVNAQMNMGADTTKSPKMNMDTSMAGMDMSGMLMMSSALSKALPMGRDGSGTSWLPDDAPTYGFMLGGGKWTYMIHGNFTLRYTNQ